MTTQQPATGTPLAEFAIDESLVYRLLAEQHADLKHLPLIAMESGWDNSMFRLGEDLVIRLPRRQLAAKLIEHEQIWLPQLAARLTLPVPVPIRIGYPGSGYPWRWSVLPWLPGMTANRQALAANQAKPLVDFLRSLHLPAPVHAPRNAYRGVPLRDRALVTKERMDRLKTQTELITPAIEQIWQRALQAPLDVPDTWLHGDLHARNVLVDRGEIVGVIDWGDLTAGDLATDLAAIWMLFADRSARQEAMAAYTTISVATWQRAQGWAILFGVVLLDTGLVDCPLHAAMGENTLRRVMMDVEWET